MARKDKTIAEYEALLESPKTVEEVAKAFGLERHQALRSLQLLVNLKIVEHVDVKYRNSSTAF